MLARAIYARKDVIFLDDVLSGQDSATENYLWDALFERQGLFRQQGTTVVLVTNASM